ncbi:MAG TPA: TetR/AcrR family transcriptional regulator [Bryobacteraceae bacterium]
MSSVRSKTSTPNDAPKEGAAVSEKARVVLAGARAVFLANGFAAATTDMIQQAAGVSKSTVYAYYPNKEALFVAVVEAECARFLKTINETQFSGKRLGETLLAMARAYLEIVLSSDALALFRMVMAEAPRLPELGRRFYVAGPARINAIVAQRLEIGISNGELELGGIGLDSAASLFANMVRGEAQMQCLTHPNAQASAVQRDQWAKDAVIAFLRALPTKRRAPGNRHADDA